MEHMLLTSLQHMTRKASFISNTKKLQANLIKVELLETQSCIHKPLKIMSIEDQVNSYLVESQLFLYGSFI